MNKKEIIEEVVVSDSASPSTNNTLRADEAVGVRRRQEVVQIRRQKVVQASFQGV